ncbi:MAG: hypothetical protein M1829_000050 [Trizodia sp. TS-e1964]|nr:MAG: hypothetical protein M1829_000050 [Trizodia sp. TS-e1964]
MRMDSIQKISPFSYTIAYDVLLQHSLTPLKNYSLQSTHRQKMLATHYLLSLLLLLPLSTTSTIPPPSTPARRAEESNQEAATRTILEGVQSVQTHFPRRPTQSTEFWILASWGSYDKEYPSSGLALIKAGPHSTTADILAAQVTRFELDESQGVLKYQRVGEGVTVGEWVESVGTEVAYEGFVRDIKQFERELNNFNRARNAVVEGDRASSFERPTNTRLSTPAVDENVKRIPRKRTTPSLLPRFFVLLPLPFFTLALPTSTSPTGTALYTAMLAARLSIQQRQPPSLAHWRARSNPPCLVARVHPGPAHLASFALVPVDAAAEVPREAQFLATSVATYSCGVGGVEGGV